LLENNSQIITHCNTPGAPATGERPRSRSSRRPIAWENRSGSLPMKQGPSFRDRD
jgi:hypothetical protein